MALRNFAKLKSAQVIEKESVGSDRQSSGSTQCGPSAGAIRGGCGRFRNPAVGGDGGEICTSRASDRRRTFLTRWVHHTIGVKRAGFNPLWRFLPRRLS